MIFTNVIMFSILRISNQTFLELSINSRIGLGFCIWRYFITYVIFIAYVLDVTSTIKNVESWFSIHWSISQWRGFVPDMAYWPCLLEDLWGRYYTYISLDIPDDVRLFSMQIIFAANSSPLSWTGASSSGFSIIVFSLDGGIAMSFTAHFDNFINQRVLLATGGILLYLREEYESAGFCYPHLAPFGHFRKLVGKPLGVILSYALIDHTSIERNNKIRPEVAQEAKPAEMGLIRHTRDRAVAIWSSQRHCA